MRQPLPDDFAKRRAESQHVSPRGQASNPGDFKVDLGQYFRAFPDASNGALLNTIFALRNTLGAEKVEQWAFSVASEKNRTKMRRIRDHFAFGNTLPGMIVSQNPPLIAVTTDLTHGIGQFNVVKVLEQPLYECGLGDAPLGTRLATVALYYDTGEKGHWSDFKPILLAAATRDENALRQAMDSFSEEDWRELEEAIGRLNSPPTTGLYRIGWI